MNKSAVLGFLVGLLVLLGGGYLLAGGGNKKSEPPPSTAAKKSPGAQRSQAQPTKTAVAGKPAIPKTPNKPVPANPPAPALRLSRHIARGNVFPPGKSIDIILSLAHAPGQTVRALGVEETLPEGWTFDAVVSGKAPDLTPQRGSTGTLEFAWFNIPEFPTAFTYRVTAPVKQIGPCVIHGQALYRTTGPEERSPLAATELRPAQPAPPSQAQAAESTTTDKTAEKEKEGTGAAFRLTRRIPAREYTPGQPLDVELSLDYHGEMITALAIVETLPPAWTFFKASGHAAPPIPPNPGTAGKIHFVWVTPPNWPATFTYTVDVPKGTTETGLLSGYAVYRTSGDEERSEVVATQVVAAGP